MSKLNRDVLYLIFEELQDNEKSLCSCLLVNKTWCETIIPILWKNPWKFLKEGKEKILFNIIISHLFDDNLSKSIENLYQKPSFNYIYFCRYLNFNHIENIIETNILLKNEIIKLFINENMKYTHLYIPQQFDFQLYLIPGFEQSFSDIEFLSCNTRINDNILVELTKICKSIKELELFTEVRNNNYEIIRLIETQKKLSNIYFINKYIRNDESFCKSLENSLIKHANNIHHLMITRQPATKILPLFINLKVLELQCNSLDITWNCLENLSLPFLQGLKASRVPIKPLASLIENTSGHLTLVKIDHIRHDEKYNKRIIEAIYQNCPNLKYLKLLFKNSNILELKNLLINCKYLIGLYIIIDNMRDVFDCDNLFKILTDSSPVSLFKFKFSFYYRKIKPDSLKLFFDNWKGRHPMILQLSQGGNDMEEHSNLMDKYKTEGIIEKYDDYLHGEDFEWI
ncbi:hypothetical protein RhiirC2_855783 [Rhizophagus irregularis]|uniref:F-box domain-containing protein n=1 Tax=Rhizophagus irregularis TaxID=588596 RepID=A0A2N1MKW7_9GLOM|nr:hypothetical protein RhiirC2_855783 [Rhizophagus irregularis]